MTITATAELTKLAGLAGRVGCPPEQLSGFLQQGYVPQPRQLELHAAARLCDEPGGPTMIGFGGARGPGKSHATFAQLCLDDCQRRPGLKGLYLRKIGKQAREQFEDLRRAVLPYTPHEYKRAEGVLVFANGSRVLLGHFKDERDIDNYLGLQYDVIVIEEATSLTLSKFRALRDSNRTSRQDWRPRIYTTTNPGGVGHAWYKLTFIDPWRDQREGDTRFIFSTVDDNAFIDPGYKAKLEENTGWRLRAYRYGDWDISAGQFFTTWQHAVHVIPPLPLPQNWRYWLALDYGFTHYTAAYLFAQDGDGTVYVVDEHAERRWVVERHAEGIKAMLRRNDVQVGQLDGLYAGADVFAARRGDSVTIADQYADCGLPLTRAQMDRISGAAQCLKYLGDVEAGVQPQLYVFDRCARLARCIPEMQHNPNRPEDVLKVDTDDDGNGGDDFYDAWRYGMMEAGAAQGYGDNPFASYRG